MSKNEDWETYSSYTINETDAFWHWSAFWQVTHNNNNNNNIIRNLQIYRIKIMQMPLE